MFEAYTIPLYNGRTFRVETEEAQDWYDPIKWYTLLEYQWVTENVKLAGEKVLECGGHHGHYSLALADNNELVVVEPHPENVAIIKRNLEGNGINAKVVEGAVADMHEQRHFSGATNGRLVNYGGFYVQCYMLKELLPDAGIIKLDIEGGEYNVLPDGIDMMPKTHTWIVELHPQYGNPVHICDAFLHAGFEAVKVCREHRKVEPYDMSEEWRTHATVIFRRAQ